MKVGCSRLDNGRAVREKSAVLEGQQDIECAKSHANTSQVRPRMVSGLPETNADMTAASA